MIWVFVCKYLWSSLTYKWPLNSAIASLRITTCQLENMVQPLQMICEGFSLMQWYAMSTFPVKPQAGISAYHISFMLLSSTSPTKSVAGIHWNFFFTIAVVSLVSTTTDSWPRIIQILRVSHSVSLHGVNEQNQPLLPLLPVTTSQQLFWTLFSHTRHDATHVPFSYFFLLFRNCLCVTSDFSLPSRLHCPASRTSPQKLPLPVLHLCLEHTSPGLKHRLATSCCEFEAHQFIIIHHNSSNS